MCVSLLEDGDVALVRYGGLFLGGYWDPQHPLISVLCSLPQVLPGCAKPKDVERKQGGKEEKMRVITREQVREKRERHTQREREREETRERKMGEEEGSWP